MKTLILSLIFLAPGLASAQNTDCTFRMDSWITVNCSIDTCHGWFINSNEGWNTNNSPCQYDSIWLVVIDTTDGFSDTVFQASHAFWNGKNPKDDCWKDKSYMYSLSVFFHRALVGKREDYVKVINMDYNLQCD